MAANNQAFSQMSGDATNADKYAIVLYKPQQHPIPSLHGEVLMPMPLSCVMPAAQHEQEVAMGKRSGRAPLKSYQISMSHRFAFTFPEHCLQYMSSLEPVMKVHKNLIRCAPQEQWFSFSERLQEWRCEHRRRGNGARVDKYFFHRNMKLRSQQELKFFVKYGFLPCKSQGKRTRQTDEEAATKCRALRYLDQKEKELTNTFSIDTHILEEVDKWIRNQLLWTKPSQTASNDKQLSIYEEGLPAREYNGLDGHLLLQLEESGSQSRPPNFKENQRADYYS